MHDETAKFTVDAPHVVVLLQTVKALETVYKNVQAELARCGAHTHDAIDKCVAPLQMTDTGLGETVSEASDLVSHRSPEFEADLKNLKSMELRKKYPREANSHRCMMDRRKLVGAEVDPRWHSFRAFLADMGPKSTKTATLDRIDNGNPTYAPGLCRWADKRTQNSNKGDSILIYDAVNGMSFTISELAKKHGVKPGTLRERLRRGWSHQELLQNFRIPAEDLQKLRARFAEEAGQRQRAAEVEALQIAHDVPKARPEPKDPIEVQVEALASKLSRPGALEPDMFMTLEQCRDHFAEGFTREQWERNFMRFWPKSRWSVDFFGLPQDQQKLAERHFPDDVSLWRRAKELADRRASEALNTAVEVEALKGSL
jgi:hypothetical protein